MDYSEQLQVVNYGIGGHYVTHYDFYPPDQLTHYPELGNRISTLLIYVCTIIISSVPCNSFNCGGVKL